VIWLSVIVVTLLIIVVTLLGDLKITRISRVLRLHDYDKKGCLYVYLIVYTAAKLV